MIIRIIAWKILGGREKRYLYRNNFVKKVLHTHTLLHRVSIFPLTIFQMFCSKCLSFVQRFIVIDHSAITRSIGHKNYISLLPFNLTFTQRLIFNWFQK